MIKPNANFWTKLKALAMDKTSEGHNRKFEKSLTYIAAGKFQQNLIT